MGAKAVIIDHEPLMAAQLKKLLQHGEPSIEVKAICYEGRADHGLSGSPVSRISSF